MSKPRPSYCRLVVPGSTPVVTHLPNITQVRFPVYNITAYVRRMPDVVVDPARRSPDQKDQRG